MKNLELSTIFGNLAELSKQKDTNLKSVIDYTRTARSIRDYPDDFEKAFLKGMVKNIAGIDSISYGFIKEFFETGEIKFYEDLKLNYSDELIKFIRISGLGKRRVLKIYEIFNVKNLKDLKDKLSDGRALDKIKKNCEIEKDLLTRNHIERLIFSIDYFESTANLFPIGYIDFFIDKIRDKLLKIKGVKKVAIVGSLRRKKSFVRDIDILVLPEFNFEEYNLKESEQLLKSITNLDFIKKMTAINSKPDNLSARYETTYGIDAEVIVSSSRRWPLDLFYTTGSKSHIKKIEEFAINRGNFPNDKIKSGKSGVKAFIKSIDMNEIINIGKLRKDFIKNFHDFKNINSEFDLLDLPVYKLLKLEYIPPELREDIGEVELASKFLLPVLVGVEDIKGDLHVHSFWSDGLIGIDDALEKCRKNNYQYIAFTDHSISNMYGNGLDEKRMLQKISYINDLKLKVKEIAILTGGEVDIRSAGKLDYDNNILSQMDFIMGSMHSNYLNSCEENTARIVSAIKNPMVDAIAHPTGVVFGSRAPYILDMDMIIDAAVKYGKTLEINSYFLRLDINDNLARKFKEKGGRVVINTDSHRLDNMDMVKLGIDVARRAGLEKKDVLNALNLEDLMEWKKGRTEK
ncbi:MAG: hypothetical protein FJW69_06090 [Actinobacteria bacterium]|nr:hypothetical protein [Actinomycetota bacterium]